METGPTLHITPVVYDLTRGGTFSEILTGLNSFWESQDPILSCIELYPHWLNDNGRPTLFPFIVKGGKFIAHTIKKDEGLNAYLNRFEETGKWGTNFKLRFILPEKAQVQ